MRIKSLRYSENHEKPDYWQIGELVFGDFNMIVGRNATGKTRLMNLLKHLANMVAGRSNNLLNGKWQIEFLRSDSKAFSYELTIDGQRVIHETIVIAGQNRLNRNEQHATIYSDDQKRNQEIEPPSDRLIVHARRDTKEYPFLEDLYEWGKHYHAFGFSEASPSVLRGGKFDATRNHLDQLSVAPHLLAESDLAGDVVSDMSRLAYRLESLKTSNIMSVDGVLAPVLSVREANVACELLQYSLSAGMHRALCVLIVFEHLLRQDEPCTFALDDIGEGLDYERSAALINVLQEKAQNSKIQVFLTSNNRHLLNAVDVMRWNILERDGHEVTSYNSSNSQQYFEYFDSTGLSNFELFVDELYKAPKKN